MRLVLFAVEELLLLKSRKQKCLTAIVTAFIFIFILNSCNNIPVNPKEDQPGRRDYEWSVDTLNYPYNPLYRIWGSSPLNVWAINTDEPGRNIFHFDGNKWSTDGVYRLVLPHSIWGFSANNVYIGGSQGMVWRFDGNDWKEVAVLQKNGNEEVVFNNMWGKSANDFYAFGAYPDMQGYFNNSVIAHYYYGKWKMINTNGLKGIVSCLYEDLTNNIIYMQSYKMGRGEFADSSLLFEYKNGRHSEIYGSIWAKGMETNISLINNEVYFILGNEIAKRVKNQFQTFLMVDNPNFYQRIWGRNCKDIFLFMTDGLVHYNGSNMEYLFRLNRIKTQIYGAALFEKEVFFIVGEGQTGLSLIYHGKLKNNKTGE